MPILQAWSRFLKAKAALGWEDGKLAKLLAEKFSALDMFDLETTWNSLSFQGAQAVAEYLEGLVAIFEALTYDEKAGLLAVELFTGSQQPVRDFGQVPDLLETIPIQNVIDLRAQLSAAVKDGESLKRYVAWYEAELVSAGLRDLPF